MYCPKCGHPSSDDLRFCKTCGTSLLEVKTGLANPPQQRAARELERLQRSGVDLNKLDINALLLAWGKAPEAAQERSEKLVQSGIITTFVGIGLTIFLYFLFTGIARAQPPGSEDREILNAMWAVGLVPFFAGLGLLLSGWLFRPKQIQTSAPLPQLDAARPASLPEPGIQGPFGSVTEHTTRQLYQEPVPAPPRQTDEIN